MSDALRDEESRILDYLSRASEERDDYISVEEIQQAFRIPLRASVQSSLSTLERKGYIRQNPRIPSGFEILRSPEGSRPKRPSVYGGGSQHLASANARVITSRPTPARNNLTPRQRQAYEIVRQGVEDGLPPTVEELRQALGLASLKRAHELLESLERKGYIRLLREPAGPGEPQKRRKSRGIELVNRPSIDPNEPSGVFVRLMGHVAAGLPITDETGATHWGDVASELIELPRELLGGNDPAGIFVLEVEGDSMIGDGVLEGDRVVVCQPKPVNDGDLVVARSLDEVTGEFELTVKRYARVDGHLWLLPANAAYEPIDGDRAEVLGRVIALLRYPL